MKVMKCTGMFRNKRFMRNANFIFQLKVFFRDGFLNFFNLQKKVLHSSFINDFKLTGKKLICWPVSGMEL